LSSSSENINYNKEEQERGEKTEIIYGSENTISKGLEFLSDAKKSFDNCVDYAGPSALVETKAMWEGVLKLKNIGVKIRFITEVTNENISYCKRIMEIAELRHLDGVKGNFGIVDGIHYGGIAKVQEKLPLSQWIHSTVKSFIEQQQYFFDMLWNKAYPAEQRIREIEEGVIPDFIETIRDCNEIQKLEKKLISTAKQEILIIFPSANTFHRQEDMGIIQLLKQESSSLKPELRIKIMTPVDYRITDTVQTLKEKYKQNIDIQYIQQSFETIASILVVDRKYSVTVEVKDDTQERNNDLSIGLAIYSNSKYTVLSFTSIFESLWRQAEIYEQLKESRIRLDNANFELQEMKQYLNEVIKEVHRENLH
jgi:two-component system sensor histidine kinase VicK